MTARSALPSLWNMITNSLEAAVAQRASSHQSPAEAVIEVSGLRKSYDDHEAVRGIDLEIHRGEIFAFLGPNGAGKTTTVEILEGFRGASAGSARVLDTDPAHGSRAWRERIGIVLQESAAEPGLTVRECLRLYAGYYRKPRAVEDTLELVGLAEQSEQRASARAGGQRRRLDVALALVGDPELIFLDEPTTGFDPSARRAAWAVIEGLRDLGKTVFLTTHYMEEAERLADRIAIIDAGRIIAQGTPRTLGGRDTAAAQITFTLPTETSVCDLPASLEERVEKLTEGRLRLSSASVASDLHVISGWALERGVDLHDLEVRRATLEDTYLALIASHQGS
jgi:ABC-2 type transport system ATP-binding protein